MTTSTQSTELGAVFSSASGRANWASETQQRRRKYRRMISLSHHLTFYLGRKFPRAIPLIFVIGYPKSGTTWVCQLLSDYLQLPFPQHSILPVGCPAVVHGHETVDKSYPQGIYVMRDGRDVAVSAFHHLRKHSQLGGKSKGSSDFFRTTNAKASAIELLPSFISHMAKHPFGAKSNWQDHIESYFQTKSHQFGLARYEDLVHQATAALESMAGSLTSEPVDPVRIQTTCSRWSFESISGRTSGTENQASYLRKGTTGDWKNYFSREAAQAFQEHFGKALIQAGYESSAAWVDTCPVVKAMIDQPLQAAE